MQNIHRSLKHRFTPFQTKTPSIQTDRGRKVRGTTSNSAFPHENALTASSNAFRCLGRARLSLLMLSRKPLREVFRRISPLPCTDRQLSGGKGNAYFIPSLCCTMNLSKICGFCQVSLYFILFFDSFISADQPDDTHSGCQPN